VAEAVTDYATVIIKIAAAASPAIRVNARHIIPILPDATVSVVSRPT